LSECFVWDEVEISGDEVCGGELLIFNPSEPEGGDLGEEFALSWDWVGEDDIECGDSIGGDHEHSCGCVVVVLVCAWGQCVGIADFSGAFVGEIEVGVEKGGSEIGKRLG